jgi:transcriptional regulator with XRE-family HTH domain
MQEGIKVSVGSAIRQVREDRQISQEELGARANLDRSYISSVENGKRNISLENLHLIARSLGVSLTEIVQLAEDRMSE